MYKRFRKGLRPSRDLSKTKLVVNTEDRWFSADGTDGSKWKGVQDASVSLAGTVSGWLLQLEIDVTDDTWVPYTGDFFSGDRLILTTGIHTAYIGMNKRFEPVVRGIDRRVIGSTSCRVIDSATLRYTFEFNIHHGIYRKCHYARGSSPFYLSVGVGFADDDGQGVKGTLAWPQPDEWGIFSCRRNQ